MILRILGTLTVLPLALMSILEWVKDYKLRGWDNEGLLLWCLLFLCLAIIYILWTAPIPRLPLN